MKPAGASSSAALVFTLPREERDLAVESFKDRRLGAEDVVGLEMRVVGVKTVAWAAMAMEMTGLSL